MSFDFYVLNIVRFHKIPLYGEFSKNSKIMRKSLNKISRTLLGIFWGNTRHSTEIFGKSSKTVGKCEVLLELQIFTILSNLKEIIMNL